MHDLFFRRLRQGISNRKFLVVMVLFGFVISSVYFGPYSGSSNGSGNGQWGNITPSVSSSYSMTFVETGLPGNAGSATVWAVNLSGIAHGQVIRQGSTELTFSRAPGTYAYSIPAVRGYKAFPGSGTVTITDANELVNVNFMNLTHTVTFMETGIMSSPVEPWSVNLSLSSSTTGIVKTSTSNLIQFQVPNGTYHYKVTSPTGYYGFPSAGIITVQGNNYFENLTFSAKEYRVFVSEVGLDTVRQGSVWYAALENTTSLSSIRQSSYSPYMNFTVPNGSYKLTISSLKGYSVSPQVTYLNVTGQSFSQKVSFVSGIYSLEFKETGLVNNYAGNPWGITLTNTTSHSSVTMYSNTSSLTFNVTDGTYSYHTINPHNYTAGPFGGSGTVTVDRANNIVDVYFSSLYFTAVFYERGLPDYGGENTTWSVTLNGIHENSSSSSLYFNLPEVTSKLYHFSVGLVRQFVPSTPTGSIASPNAAFSVTPNVITQIIKFSYSNSAIPSYQHTLHNSPVATLNFFERGLPAGQSWSVFLNNTTKKFLGTSVTGSISFAKGTIDPNGIIEKYYFSVFPSGNYSAIVDVSNAIIWNSTVFENVSVVFVNTLHTVTFLESGLPAGDNWTIAVTAPDGENIYQTSSGNPLAFELQNGTYHFRVGSSNSIQSSVKSGVFVINNSKVTVSPSSTIVFRSAEHALTFKENGLTLNKTSAWKVDILGVPSSPEIFNSSYTFDLTNGTYYYAITGLSNLTSRYSPNPGYGLVEVNGTDVSVTIHFVSITYAISFKETGLSASPDWSVTLVGGNATYYSHGTGTVYMHLANGTYFYTVQATTGYSSNRSSGILVVSGASSTVLVSFHNILRNLSFTVSSLPAGASWKVIVNGLALGTTGSSVTATVGNGTYFYRVMTSTSSFTSNYTYYPFPAEGYVNITGSATNVAISFRDFVYTVPFKQTGLNPGSNFSVELNGKSLFSQGTSYVNFTEQNGTYHYSVPFFKENFSKPSAGSISVIGPQNVTTLAFVLEKMYKVTFVEFNSTPSIGNIFWNWGLRISGPLPHGYNNSVNTAYNSSTTKTVSYYLPNGTFSYEPLSGNKVFRAPKSGQFTINNATHAPIYLNYTELKYSETFYEANLPTGTPWSLTVNGSIFRTTNSSIVVQLHNGSYNYKYQNTTNYTVSSGQIGTVLVRGAASSVIATYGPILYTLSFNETGLPANSSWSVTVGAITLFSHGSRYVNFSEPNGSIGYFIPTYQYFHPVPSASNVSVSGNTQVNVVFKSSLYKVTFTASNLTAGYRWGVKYSSQYQSGNISTNGASIVANLSNGTYSFHVYSMSNFFKPPSSGIFTVAGKPVFVSLNFTNVTFNLTIQEAGLESGTTWRFILNGTTYTTHNSSMTFPEHNGTFTYKFLNVTGYNLTSVQSGQVTINGSLEKITANYHLNAKTPPPPPAPTKKFSLPTYAIVAIIAIAVVGAGVGAAIMMQRKKKVQ